MYFAYCRRADVNFDRALYPCAAVAAAAKEQKASLDRRKLLEECSGGEKRAAVDKVVREIAEAVERRESEESKGDKGKKKKSIVETIMEKVRLCDQRKDETTNLGRKVGVTNSDWLSLQGDPSGRQQPTCCQNCRK